MYREETAMQATCEEDVLSYALLPEGCAEVL